MLKFILLSCLAVGLTSSKSVHDQVKRFALGDFQIPSDITVPPDDEIHLISSTGVQCHTIQYSVEDVKKEYIGGTMTVTIYNAEAEQLQASTSDVANTLQTDGDSIYSTLFENLDECTHYNITADIVAGTETTRTSSVVQTSCLCGGGGGTGDPHYRTIDGRRFDFNGQCSYVLLQDCENNPPTWEIHAQHGMLVGGKARRIVGVKAITREPREHVVSMHEHSRVVLDGHTYKDGIFYLPNMRLENTKIPDTKELTLNDHSLWVSYGNHVVNVGVTEDDNVLQGKVCGLLGNNNGNPDDDFTMPNGELAEDVQEFGKSWMVPDSC